MERGLRTEIALLKRQRQEDRARIERLEKVVKKVRREMRICLNLNGCSGVVMSTPMITPVPRPHTVQTGPPADVIVPSPDNDEGGDDFLTSFETSMLQLSARGDPDLQTIIDALRNEGLRRAYNWSPKKLEIVDKKSSIIKWVLRTENVHKFKDISVTYTTAKDKSMWTGLVNELYSDLDNNARSELIKYFARTCRSTSFFAGFVSAVVRVHNANCRQCGPQ